MSFDRACRQALEELRALQNLESYFDYILIDESQDFPDSFVELCKIVTKETVYVAGDIFQSIFDDNIAPTIEPDFLLSKCYRTDPRTLMFAHAIGMGLFEQHKLRWLEDDEWRACGYVITKRAGGSAYRLTREPLRRFEDIDNSVPSVVVNAVQGEFWQSTIRHTIDTIKALANEHTSLTPDDVGIILLDTGDIVYTLADQLAIAIRRELGWQVNKAHETKRREANHLFISNRNNVKGLEFPFVICISQKISTSYKYRNALYMTLTRSFLQSYLVISSEQNANILPNVLNGLQSINVDGCIEVSPPGVEEQARIKTTIKAVSNQLSFFDMVEKIFDEIGVLPIMREQVFEALKKVIGEDLDEDNIRDTTRFIYNKMLPQK